MRMTRLMPLLAACWIVPVLGGSLPVELVSRTDIAAHIGADGSSIGPGGVSANGRFVVFASTASNLVEGDHNGITDLFLHDLDTGATERVNVANDGSETDVSAHLRAGVSDDGRYVVFSSADASLVTEPTFGVAQVYRRDRVAGTTQLLSRGSNGLAGNFTSTMGNISADGRYTVFDSVSNLNAMPTGYPQVYRHDAVSNTLELVSATPAATPGSHMSWNPQVSNDGRYVLFVSFATDLVANDTNASIDLFLRDMQLGTTQRVSVSSDGSQLADPGSIEYFMRCRVNLVSSDGRYVVFATEAAADATDTNGVPDIYRFDRIAGTTQRISHPVGSVAPYVYNVCPTISADGQRIAWWSYAGYYMQGASALYLRDLGAGTLRPLLPHTVPTTLSLFSDMTLALPGDGRGLFFASDVLMPGSRYSHIYRFDTDSDLLTRLSESPASSFGPFANDHSNDTLQSVGVGGASASADGRYVVFASHASNLVVSDTNGVADIFLRDRLTATTQRISQRSDGSQIDCISSAPSIEPDGRYIVFTSCGALAAPATGKQREVYRYDRITGGIELVSVGPSGQRANGDSFDTHLSDDGRIVGFASCATDLLAAATTHCQVFARDMLAGTTQLISRTAAGQSATGSAAGVRVAGSGQYVLFGSAAADLVAGDTNNQFDVFAHDRLSQATQRLNIASDGTQGNSWAAVGGASWDGRRVVFTSTATNLVPDTASGRNRVYLRDLDTLTTSLIAIPGDGDKSGSWPSLSADGTRIVFISSTANSGMSSFNDRGRDKLYLFDRPSGSYRVLSWFERATSFSYTSSPRFIADGTKIVFDSTRDDLVKDDGNGAFTDVFLLHLNDGIFADSFEASVRLTPTP
jgi:Tol biopolymer transport system component